jgi:two-component system response regulator
MPRPGRRFVILVADDDGDDFLLLKEALLADPQTQPALGEIRNVRNGEELMRYLLREGEYADPRNSPRPDLIFLDLNMPRKDGLSALREIRSDARLRHIPVNVFSVSNNIKDVLASYQNGANSFLTKPARYSDLVQMINVFKRYWLETVRLPGRE